MSRLVEKLASSLLQAGSWMLTLVLRRSNPPITDPRSAVPLTRQCYWVAWRTSRLMIPRSYCDARLHTVIQRQRTVCPHLWTSMPSRSYIESRCRVLLQMSLSPGKSQNDNNCRGHKRRSSRRNEKQVAPPSEPSCRPKQTPLMVSMLFYLATL